MLTGLGIASMAESVLNQLHLSLALGTSPSGRPSPQVWPPV